MDDGARKTLDEHHDRFFSPTRELRPERTKAMLVIEWLGAILGIAGSLLLSMNGPWSGYAWPIWILSNAFLMAVAATVGTWGIFGMQAAFLLINANGIWRWLFRPPHAAARGNHGEDQISAWSNDCIPHDECAPGRRPDACPPAVHRKLRRSSTGTRDITW